MDVRSLAYQTDLMFPRFDGRIIDRGDYLVVQTPANPGFYWGNYLLFPAPPAPADVERWPAAFELEHPHARHVALGWDDDGDGAADELAALGYELIDDAVLIATEAPPAPAIHGFDLRALATPGDWAAMWRLNIICDPQQGSTAGYDAFKEALRQRYRAMVEAGRGRWLGAFDGDDLVGALGVFADGTLARLQSVETHPEHRGRGVCSALTAAAIATGLGELGAARVVVVANRESQAERIYRRAGFRPDAASGERQRGAYLVTR